MVHDHSTAAMWADPSPTPLLPRVPLSMRDRIGHYRLQRIIAFGGMSTVYEAVDEKLRRTVAFKVMKGRPGSAEAPRRFESEARILARLRHPGIAHVYDVGTHTDGGQEVPYFVMEYIPNARPITEYARVKNLEVREKLELFAAVCDAVQHGHQHDVVHRDLKPANIVVDSSGQPKIIDFGVARATDPDLALIDTHGELIGTLQYMSPEQVEPDPRDVDARSDVYALGLVLYELLCGKPPYEVPDTPVAEARRVIRERQPAMLGVVDRRLRGDIETIVHKALQKDRRRRFESAGALAADVKRWLGGEPIEARRDSTLYVWRTKTRQAIARHPVESMLPVVAVAAMAAWLIGGPLVFRWTPADAIFRQTVTSVFGTPASDPSFEAVRMIVLTDETDVAALAEKEGFADVGLSDIKSLRRLHGRLLERLARAGPRVVAWDMVFVGETRFDGDFVRGVRAVRDADIDVIVASPSWQVDEEGMPSISRNILPHVRWGGATAWFDAAEPWRLDLVVEKEINNLVPSIALAALTSYQHPEGQATMNLDPRSGSLEIRYWRRSPLMPTVGTRIGEPFRIELSDIAIDEGRTTVGNVRRGDLVGRYQIAIPSDDVLSAASVDYGDVFYASDLQLRRWFDNKAVVVGSARAGIDIHGHPDGRRIYACYGYGAAIDTLLRSASVRLPRPLQVWTMLLVAAMLGALIGAVASRDTVRRYAMLALVTVGAFVGSAVAYQQLQYLCNPIMPVLAMIVAAELSARIVGVRFALLR